MILAAEPGATLRLGFRTDVDAKSFGTRVAAGRRDQQRLRELCGGALGDDALQSELKPWLADRVATPDALEPRWRPLLAKRWPDVANVLRALHAAYWDVLDLMNEIPVAPGQVLYNATPDGSRPRYAYRARPKSTRSATRKRSRSWRSRFVSPARPTVHGTTCAFRSATSTPTPRSRR